MSLYRISYRLIGLFMVVVALWRMNGGGDELVEGVKYRLSNLIPKKEAVVMRPYYPSGGSGSYEEAEGQVDAASSPQAPTVVSTTPAVEVQHEGDYYSDWRR